MSVRSIIVLVVAAHASSSIHVVSLLTQSINFEDLKYTNTYLIDLAFIIDPTQTRALAGCVFAFFRSNP